MPALMTFTAARRTLGLLGHDTAAHAAYANRLSCQPSSRLLPLSPRSIQRKAFFSPQSRLSLHKAVRQSDKNMVTVTTRNAIGVATMRNVILLAAAACLPLGSAVWDGSSQMMALHLAKPFWICTDQIMDNLIRAHDSKPFVQLKYSSIQTNDEDHYSITGTIDQMFAATSAI